MNKKKILSDIIVLILLSVLIIITSKLLYSPVTILSRKTMERNEEYKHTMQYGIIVDSLKVHSAKVRRNQFLSDILLDYNVDYAIIDKLVRISKPVFDVRKIRAGNNYAVITTNDSVPRTLYFIYEENPASYIVFNIYDTILVYRGKKPVNIINRTISGVIHSSLWETMVQQGDDPNLANELSEIFAWTIDFFGIRDGDYYKVMYEELIVDNNPIGIGKIKAALFNHIDRDYYSFYFIQDSVGDYFDEDAGSMRRTFLKAPLRFKRISSRFSYRRYHPVLKIYRPHTGIDYAAASGTPVYTVGDGTVIAKGWDNKGGGNYIKVRHNGTYTTTYMHLSKFAKGIRKGKKVKQGDLIGYVGATGLATGPHLDFRFYRNGKAINPLKVESPPAEPVDSACLERFYHLRDSLTMCLDKIDIQ